MNARRPNCLPVPKYTPFSPRGPILWCSTKSLPPNNTIPHPNGRKNDMSGCFPVRLMCGESPCRLVRGHELQMSVTHMTAAPQNANGIPLCSSAARSPRPSVLLSFYNPRVRKIRNEASSCPGIFSGTLRFYYVASSPGSPLPHLLDGHRKLVGSSAIPARSCPGPVWYHWGSIVELEVPPDETPGLMTLHPHNTNVLQSITYAKSPYPPDRSNPGQKN